jgi:selenocysteine-specific elongation factor
VTGAPLTVGTAGHVDHGKTALVAALTGTDTDRLAEEKARGLSIELGFAAVALPSGRPMSLIDVPGHERFIRTMVSGATGIDAFLMVIAATDGVGEQTVEHARILSALGIAAGIVAITKTDLASGAATAATAARARELLPGAPVVVCPPDVAARAAPVREGLDELARGLPGRASQPGGPAILHIDRSFTIPGAGTVVTGTLVSGAVAPGDRLTAYPDLREVRVRGVQVHAQEVGQALAGQRVAINLARVSRTAVARGDALATPGALRAAFTVDVAPGTLDADLPPEVHVHHGTRATAARVGRARDTAVAIRLRCRRPLLVAAGDALVLRDGAGRRTLGGAVVLAPKAAVPGHRAPASSTVTAGGARVMSAVRRAPGALALADRIDPGELARVEAEVRAAIVADGQLTLPGLRDRLGVSRREAKAYLDYFDEIGVTRRRADDTRVLRRVAPVVGSVAGPPGPRP